MDQTDRPGNARITRVLSIVLALLLIPFLVFAATKKTDGKVKSPGWRKDYQPRTMSEQELLKACAYGNIKACSAYHEKYILPGN